ncbi:hypothetical protein EDB89DRAFT_1961776 [Lactarius sanguifluus]|nr:hypothetical protein EDB89DRAFT_1961776 [Lactarius sanguifluus]
MALDDIGHFECDDDLELTRWSRLQADRAHICVRVVEVATSEAPPTLCNRRIEHRSLGQPHVGRACSFVDRCVILHTGSSLQRHPCAVRYDHHSTIPSRQSSLSALDIRTLCTGTILDGRIFALLVRGHVWLESGAGMFWSRWDMSVCGPNGALIFHLNLSYKDEQEVGSCSGFRGWGVCVCERERGWRRKRGRGRVGGGWGRTDLV